MDSDSEKIKWHNWLPAISLVNFQSSVDCIQFFYRYLSFLKKRDRARRNFVCDGNGGPEFKGAIL